MPSHAHQPPLLSPLSLFLLAPIPHPHRATPSPPPIPHTLAASRHHHCTHQHRPARNKQFLLLLRSRSTQGKRKRGLRGAGDRDWSGPLSICGCNRRGPERDWECVSGEGAKRRRAGAMGRLFLMHLEGNVYSCKHCKTHLGLAGDIISKSFHSKHGKAYLFNKVVNVTNGVKEDRMMITGLHTVCDIFCVGCGSVVGWKYVAAHEKSQRYKEGKFILERYKVSGPDGSSYWATHDVHLGGSDADDV